MQCYVWDSVIILLRCGDVDAAERTARDGKSLMGDVYGGLTAAVVALPLALAFGVASAMGWWSQWVVATLYLKRQR